MDLLYYFVICCLLYLFFFFFNDTATTEIYTLSYTTLFRSPKPPASDTATASSGVDGPPASGAPTTGDRKSTRLNSSHQIISYAVFCLKKKKTKTFTKKLMNIYTRISKRESTLKHTVQIHTC